MPFCTQCANAIPEGARFCSSCGTPVATPEPVAADKVRVSAASTIDSGGAALAWMPHGRFEPGTRLGTRYRIVALLGKGGMGEVYRADDLELGQSVALKFLRADKAARPALLAQFRGEVRTARLIAHPNVCRVYDIGEADGQVFLSMEYIDGEDLATVIRRLGRPTSDKALAISRELCLGLAAAHEAGMLHRDLKPANVMIDGRGRARITDFGLAGLAEELAREGQAAGTPAYMAPEQLAQGKVSVRSDVYSLGLVLYELFTGRRVFEAKSLAELRQMQESGSITTPSDVTRDVDPAVERVIMHCLEHDPDARPTSAYAVLAALPGGDPLAAALAAGETPSPELVANSGERGTLRPATAALWFSLGLFGLGVWGGTIGPEFRALPQPTPVLDVRANDLIARTGALGRLPAHTGEGFSLNRAQLEHQRGQPNGGSARTPVYFWRRWSPDLLSPVSIHRALIQADDPPTIGPGDAVVLLDPAGRLIGLRAIPADTMPALAGGRPAWRILLAATGLDSSALTPAALVRPVPATCDSAAAWTARLPWSGGEAVTIQAGASRGRLVDLSIVHDWGASTDPLDAPLLVSIIFGTRNLRLGRGDWRTATRLGVFVFVTNLAIATCATRLSEVGLVGLGSTLLLGRGFGHAAIHAFEIWFAYMAVEPYARRLWPRILVSWARLVSGRWRDPLVGRDVLLGATSGSVLTTLGYVVAAVGARFGLFRVPTVLTTETLQSLTNLANTGCQIAYGASICILGSLSALVMILLMRLVFRRTWPAVLIAFLVVTAATTFNLAATNGLTWALILAIVGTLPIFLLTRFGLLAAAVSIFVLYVMGAVVGSLDLSSWYADRALVPALMMVALFAYGAWAALAGKPIFGDPLREGAK
jgi:eukaryotic-like serine/threonine-protein kinase